MERIIIEPKNDKQLLLLKSLFEEMKITYKTFSDLATNDEAEYNATFVKKIKERMENVKNGNYIVLTDDYKKELFG